MKFLKKAQVYVLLIVLGATILNGCKKDEISLKKGEITHENVESKTNLKGGPIGRNTVTDIDGNVYNKVIIGTQTWLVENLRTTKYRNGAPIGRVTDGAIWKNLTDAAYCWYDNDVSNKATYGALYNGYAASDSRNIAPLGCHVPTEAEWTTLINYLGGKNVASGKMKETGTMHWDSPNTGATNESGFTALPGGERYIDWHSSHFGRMGAITAYWSVSEHSASSAYYTYITVNWDRVYNGNVSKNYGISIRCIWDFDAPLPPSSSLATVSTDYPSSIGSTWATPEGDVISDGGASVTSRGFCWNTSRYPTIANSKKSAGSGTGHFVSTITGLTTGVSYWIRAYATNSAGTAYGNQIRVIPSGNSEL